jgi:hypothetical protein
MKIFFILFSWLLLSPKGFSQNHKPEHISVAVTTLHTAFPFGSFAKLFTEDFHPGFEVGTGFNWRTKPKHDWFQAFVFGYSYHRFVQHSLALYSEAGYRYKFLNTFSTEAKLGVGYLHAISTGKVFKLREDGNYKKKTNLGRPQAMAGFSLGAGKKVAPSGLSVFIEYQQRVQFPFIKSYVPLLPSNIGMAGVKIPLKKTQIRDIN